MKNITNHSRRKFLTTSVGAAVFAGASATFAGTFFKPFTLSAQGSTAAIQSKIALLGNASLQTSLLAATKAVNPEVKMFAKFETAEQETIGKILKDMGTVVPPPGAEQKALLAKLQAASGNAFDQAFMLGQVDTHQKLHQAVSELLKQSTDVHVKHVASLALATITEHTERGQILLKKLG